MISHHDSACYANRLEKYAKRYGFSVALPGYQQELVSGSVLKRPYVLAPSCDMLFHILEIGKPEIGKTTLHHAGTSASLTYSMRHVAKRIIGVERFVVQNHPCIEFDTIHTPTFGHTCPNCELLVAEPASKTGAVVITPAGAPGLFHLLFDCALPAPDGGESSSTPYSEDLSCDDDERCSTMDGYACTPLAKARCGGGVHKRSSRSARRLHNNRPTISSTRR